MSVASWGFWQIAGAPPRRMHTSAPCSCSNSCARARVFVLVRVRALVLALALVRVRVLVPMLVQGLRRPRLAFAVGGAYTNHVNHSACQV